MSAFENEKNIEKWESEFLRLQDDTIKYLGELKKLEQTIAISRLSTPGVIALLNQVHTEIRVAEKAIDLFAGKLDKQTSIKVAREFIDLSDQIRAITGEKRKVNMIEDELIQASNMPLSRDNQGDSDISEPEVIKKKNDATDNVPTFGDVLSSSHGSVPTGQVPANAASSLLTGDGASIVMARNETLGEALSRVRAQKDTKSTSVITVEQLAVFAGVSKKDFENSSAVQPGAVQRSMTKMNLAISSGNRLNSSEEQKCIKDVLFSRSETYLEIAQRYYEKYGA